MTRGSVSARIQELKTKVMELSPETTDPKYVGEIFDKFLLPRISTDRGRRRLSADEAALRVRRLNIVAHCHGAYTALRLEEMMQEKMKELAREELGMIDSNSYLFLDRSN